MFTFCPSCASEEISFEKGKIFHCPDCGFHYYHNVAAATACLISVPDHFTSSGNPRAAGQDSPPAGGGGEYGAQRLMFLVRGREPAKGKLDLPGGFVDPGEGALEGLCRELREELGWTPPIPPGADLSRIFTLFASFPNVYPYKDIAYNTCDLFFTVSAMGLTEQDLRLEQAEITGVRFLKPEEIDYDEIAFESVRRAVKAYLAALS